MSYARDDKEKVEILHQNLIKAGCNPWIDTENIYVGELFEGVIKKKG